MLKMDFKILFILAITVVLVCPSLLTSISSTAPKLLALEKNSDEDNQMSGDIESKNYMNSFDTPKNIPEQLKKNILNVQRRRQKTRVIKYKKVKNRRNQIWRQKNKNERERRSVEETGYSEREDPQEEIIRINQAAQRDDQEDYMRNKQSTLMWYYWWYNTFIATTQRTLNVTTEAPRTMMPLYKMIFRHKSSTTLKPTKRY
ncbi:Hypothetical protein CINCED_3A008181 [Cinara cedri]|nr:Hypothetical protein CINCED_3A008181 [Cinara cedri]